MKHARYAVLGLGEFGQALSSELSHLGCEVLAVDRNPKLVEKARDEVAMAAVADIRSAAALRELFNTPFDGAVIAIGGNLEASILATLHLQELKVPRILAEATTPEAAEVLRRVGATDIFSPERDSGRRLAGRLANPNLVEFIPLTSGYGVVEVEAPAWTHGKTLAELDLRRRFSLAAIAIRSPDEGVAVVPGGRAQIRPGDKLTLVGRDEDLAKFREIG